MRIDEFKDIEQWSREQWERAKLGDKRRNNRAVKLGQAIAAQPNASLPKQTGSWGELKAAYRLLNEPDVTHTALSQQHWQTSISKSRESEKTVLFIQDTTELDFTCHPNTTGLGHIGDTKGRGFELHSCLAVIPKEDNAEVIGIAAQKVWTRDKVHRGNETRAQRFRRRTEYDVWAELIEIIGSAPNEKRDWVSVGDRASDNFSYLRRAQAKGWHCIVRVSKDRIIKTPNGNSKHILQWARKLIPQAETTITLRGRNGLPKRDVQLKVAWSEVTLCPPHNGPEQHQAAINGWCIRCWSDGRVKNPLEWILFTTIEINDAESALEKIGWYSLRWIIEEYHKCLKTGCAMEKRQLETAEGLLAMLGFLAIVAVRLLQLRDLSRRVPELLAQTVIPKELTHAIALHFGFSSEAEMTLSQFWHLVARLGGFIGRKSDGEPGWQTLWQGWQRLQDLAWGLPLPNH